MNDEVVDQRNRRGARGQVVGGRGSVDADVPLANSNRCNREEGFGPGSSLR